MGQNVKCVVRLYILNSNKKKKITLNKKLTRQINPIQFSCRIGQTILVDRCQFSTSLKIIIILLR